MTPRPLALLALAAGLAFAVPSRAQVVRDDFWVANGTVNAAVVSGHTLYIGGNFTHVGPASGIGGATRNHVAAIDLDTGAATAWDPDANQSVHALAVQGSAVYVGGVFSTIGGQPRNRLAAIDSVTGLATPWDPNANSIVAAIAADGARVYAGGYFTSIGGQARRYLAALDATSGVALPWNPDAGSIVDALSSSGSTVYAGGAFTSIGGQLRNSIAALDSGTGLATAWDPNATGFIYALVAHGSTVYAGGDFTGIGGQPRNNIAALDSATGLATAWDPDAQGLDGNVKALAILEPFVYAAGSFATIGGQSRRNLAGLDLVSAQAANWNPSPNGAVYALAASEAAVYAGGTFDSLGATPRGRIASMQDVTTPAAIAFVRSASEPGRVRLTWFSGGERYAAVTVWRRESDTEWQAIASAWPDGAGFIEYEDRRVVAGGRYGYRLGVSGGGSNTFFGEAWVEVAVAGEPRFALAGSLANPVRHHPDVAFTLPDAAPARLELIDIAGRVVLGVDVRGPGTQTIALSPERALAPGVYVVRLARGGRSLTSRIVVTP